MIVASSPSPKISGSPTYRSHSYHASHRNLSLSSSPLRTAHPSRASRPSVTAPSPRVEPALPSAPLKGSETPSNTEIQPEQPSRSETVDAGTQYTPPGYPPTYRREERRASRTKPHKDVLPFTQQREASASLGYATAESPGSKLRVAPPLPAPDVIKSTPPQTSTSALAQTLLGSSIQDNITQPSPKRARQSDPAVKVMPLKYERCDVKELGVLIADMLMELVRLNDKIPLKEGQLTRFHSRYI
jgi:hypothetical protein